MKDDLPLPSRGIIGYRAMLRLMPTCIVGMTTLGSIGLSEAVGLRWALSTPLWVALNFATTFGIGIFESHLRYPPPPHRVDSAANYVYIQFFIVSAFSIGVAAFIWRAFAGV